MINNSDTNFVYLSDKLREWYPKVHYLFTDAMERYGVEYGYLNGTNDVWCRDFMPIQLDEKRFVQFNYDPSYLKKKNWTSYRTDASPIMEELELEVSRVDLNLDGGNIVCQNNVAIVSERVFDENPNRTRKEVIRMLMDSLELRKLLAIPCLGSIDDMTGHADGYVRLINNDLAFIQKLPKRYQSIERSIAKTLAIHGYAKGFLPHEKEPIDVSNNKDATGCFINYLEVGKQIFVPYFDKEKDKDTLNFISHLYKGDTAIGVECNDIAKEGGLLNCITWNIKRN